MVSGQDERWPLSGVGSSSAVPRCVLFALNYCLPSTVRPQLTCPTLGNALMKDARQGVRARAADSLGSAVLHLLSANPSTVTVLLGGDGSDGQSCGSCGDVGDKGTNVSVSLSSLSLLSLSLSLFALNYSLPPLCLPSSTNLLRPSR